MSVQIRAYDAKLDVLEGERAVVATINTDAVDRYRTVILPRGAILDNYNKCRVVLLNHGMGSRQLPIAKNQWIRAYSDRIVAKTIFPTEDVSLDGDEAFKLYQGGFLRAFSIAFDPLPDTYGKPTARELEMRPDWKEAAIIFRSWELLEYSVVGVPGNADAVADAVSRGLVRSIWLDRVGSKVQEPHAREAPPPVTPVVPTLPPLEGRTLAQAEAALRARIRSEIRGNFARTVQDARDLARGRV